MIGFALGNVMNMGVTLAIYGNIPGLLFAGWSIQRIGYPMTVTLYGAVALILIVIVVMRWRAQLWRREAPANHAVRCHRAARSTAPDSRTPAREGR